MQTVVAVAAVVLVILFAEIMQQQLPATYRRLGIRGRFLQQLAAYILLGHGLALHELLELLQVLIRIESYALSFSAVASGASRFLVIAFKTLRNIIMDDEAHVRFVNAHAERYRRNNHVDALH